MTRAAETFWTAIKTTEQLAAYWSDVAKVDLSFAARAQAWWHNQDGNSLRAKAHQAWLCNDSEAYMLARSYAAYRNIEI